MIWAADSHLEILPQSLNCGLCDLEIEEACIPDSRMIARHLIHTGPGIIWEVRTQKTGAGFTTTCGLLHGPSVSLSRSSTQQRAMIDHFAQLAGLIAPSQSAPNR